MPDTRTPIVEGWFTLGDGVDGPALLGNRCTTCGTVFFPKTSGFCRNPDCAGDEFEETALSRRGTIWSYTDAQYQPPAPFVAPTDPYEPFAIAAVELAAEQIVVLGQMVAGVAVEDLRVGQTVELVVDALDADHTVWKWRPA
jgi:uncharacterized OB-fold protein